jgi:hypothetical protein
LDKYKTLIRSRDLEITQLHSYVDEMRIKNNDNIDKNTLKNMFESIIDNLPLNVTNDVKKDLLKLAKYLNVVVDINLNENIRKQPYRKSAPKNYKLKEHRFLQVQSKSNLESESDKIEDALKEFDGDYDIEELRLMRIKFISEVAN